MRLQLAGDQQFAAMSSSSLGGAPNLANSKLPYREDFEIGHSRQVQTCLQPDRAAQLRRETM